MDKSVDIVEKLVFSTAKPGVLNISAGVFWVVIITKSGCDNTWKAVLRYRIKGKISM